MSGMLLLFFFTLFLDSYVGAIDKYNGTVENTVHAVVWTPLFIYILVNIIFGG